MLGLYGDNGKENGSCRGILGFMRIMEKKMETTIAKRGVYSESAEAIEGTRCKARKVCASCRQVEGLCNVEALTITGIFLKPPCNVHQNLIE